MENEFETVTVTVTITRHKSSGALETRHGISEESKAIVKSWPTEGLVQVAYAMSIEALRREAWMMLVMMKSRMKPEEITVEAVSERVVGQMLGFVHDNAKAVSEWALASLHGVP